MYSMVGEKQLAQTSLIYYFINVFIKRATAFHRQANIFELNFFARETFNSMVKIGREIILSAGQSAWFPALNENIK